MKKKRLPCDYKIGYINKFEARNASLSAKLTRGDVTREYECHHCFNWHLTSKGVYRKEDTEEEFNAREWTDQEL